MRQFAIGFALGLLLSASVASAFGQFTWSQRLEIEEIAEEVTKEHINRLFVTCTLLGEFVNCVIY